MEGLNFIAAIAKKRPIISLKLKKATKEQKIKPPMNGSLLKNPKKPGKNRNKKVRANMKMSTSKCLTAWKNFAREPGR
jgi:hypothetical protein